MAVKSKRETSAAEILAWEWENDVMTGMIKYLKIKIKKLLKNPESLRKKIESLRKEFEMSMLKVNEIIGLKHDTGEMENLLTSKKFKMEKWLEEKIREMSSSKWHGVAACSFVGAIATVYFVSSLENRGDLPSDFLKYDE